MHGGASWRYLPNCGCLEKQTAARAANLFLRSSLPPCLVSLLLMLSLSLPLYFLSFSLSLSRYISPSLSLSLSVPGGPRRNPGWPIQAEIQVQIEVQNLNPEWVAYVWVKFGFGERVG